MKMHKLAQVGAIALTLAGWTSLAADPNFTFDTVGDLRYSKENFTDLTPDGYDAEDGWVELKLSCWSDTGRTFGLYLNAIPVYASDDTFWWQRNVTLGGGLQWYPVPDTRENRVWRGLRLYAWAGWRDFYDVPDDAVEPEDVDIQIGFDYYHDTLAEPPPAGDVNGWDRLGLVPSVWMNMGYRRSNFSIEDYDGFVSLGNAKLGPRWNLWSPAALYPYGLVDWAWSPSHEDRWYENYGRIGCGVALFPTLHVGRQQGRELAADLLSRLHVYAEVVHNVAWLGDSAPDSVEETDYRFGIAFSTGAFVGRP